MRKLIDEKKLLLTKADKVKEDIKKKTGEAQEMKSKLPYRSIADMDHRIDELESQIESGQFRLIEEKQILAEISKLRKMKKSLDSIDGSSGDVNTIKLRFEKLRGEVAEKDQQINNAKAKVDAIAKKVEELIGNKQESQASKEARSANIDRLKKELEQLYEERKNAIEEFRAAKKAQAEAREKRETRRAEYEKRRELEDKLEKLEEELLAFNSETANDRKISECNNIKAFFSELISGDAEEKAGDAGKIEDDGIRRVQLSSELADAEVIKKGDDDFFFAPKSKKQISASKSTPTANASLAKRVPYHIMSALADLSLPIPVTVGDIPALFKAIEAKKAFFLSKQDDAVAEMESRREALKKPIEELRAEIAKPIKIEKKGEQTGNTA